MSQLLHMIHLRPNLYLLVPWAHRQGLVLDQGQGDLGYAFHAALKAAFGDIAPQPFCYLGNHGLLGYSPYDEALRTAAALAAPELACMLGLDATAETPGLLIRPFPHNWETGVVLSFELRARPIIRTKDGRERDAFLAAVEHQPEVQLTRHAVYADWLKRQFSDAADLHELETTQFRLSAVLRRGAQSADGTRPKRPVLGPDAVFKGVLQVRDAASFAALLARGVGRHRAFGFGMLLLKPAPTNRV